MSTPGTIGQPELQDFVNRYQQDPPAEGYSEQEALQHYQQVAPQLPPEDYQQVAQAAFERMTPQERAQFGQYLAEQARQQGYNFPGLHQEGAEARFQEPSYLAQATSQVDQRQPGLLGQLLGGAAGGANVLGSPVAKGALGGIAAFGLARLFEGGRGGC